MEKTLKILAIVSLVAVILCVASTFVRADVDAEIRALSSWLDSNSSEAAVWLQGNLTSEQYAALKAFAFPQKSDAEVKAVLEQTATELRLKGVPETDNALVEIDKRVDQLAVEIAETVDEKPVEESIDEPVAIK